MKDIIFLLSLTVLLIGCQPHPPTEIPAITSISTVNEPAPAEKSVWSIYDADPDHLWNRVFRQFYRRTALSGEEYGFDELDPLLWFDTKYLLSGPSQRQAIQVLDEFLSSHGENLIRSPLKRAMFQRDLWAVFDWLASQSEPYPSERQALEARLAQVLRRVALSREDILSLPNNYALEVEDAVFPRKVLPDDPEAAFLPTDLMQPGSAWVPMGREGGPIAMTHTEAAPFFGRSIFIVFVRSPEGRAGTLDFIESLNTETNPVTAIGSEVALVRRMLLIDERGDLVLSPLVETVQIRPFDPRQHFHEFELDRTQLLQGSGGGLIENSDLFMLFMSHGDVFQNPDISKLRVAIPDICKACHSESDTVFQSGNTDSIISYSRQPFSLPDNSQPIVFPTTVAKEAQTVVEWKRNHETWKALKVLWQQTSP